MAGGTGVKGFFREYGRNSGPRKAKPVTVEQREESAVDATSDAPKGKKAQKVRARVGRPPGIVNGSRQQKEKATMHVDEELLNFYRDWSWEARCNLGELIERAMLAYRDASKPLVKKNTRNG